MQREIRLLEGLRHLRDEGAAPGAAACSRRRCSSPTALTACSARRRPVEHVVDDQPERVDVGALIDVLAARLLGRHVFDGADDLASDRRGGSRDVLADRDDRALRPSAGRRRRRPTRDVERAMPKSMMIA